jgi:hypothetical protein
MSSRSALLVIWLQPARLHYDSLMDMATFSALSVYTLWIGPFRRSSCKNILRR